MRFLRGIGSWARRALAVDPQVAAYIVFGGPKRSFWGYFPYFVSIISLSIALFRNPAGGVAFVVVIAIASVFVLYSLGVLPKLRWHILSDDISLRFHDPQAVHTTETSILRLRCILRHCDTLTFPISFAGSLAIGEVSQDGNRLQETTDPEAPGYMIDKGLGAWTLQIKLPRSLGFGDETTIVINHEEENGYPKDEEYRFYVVRTLIDSLTIRVSFHRHAYPTTLVGEVHHGVSVEQDPRFVPLRTAEGANHTVETWRPGELMYGREYYFRWRWERRQIQLGPARNIDGA